MKKIHIFSIITLCLFVSVHQASFAMGFWGGDDNDPFKKFSNSQEEEKKKKSGQQDVQKDDKKEKTQKRRRRKKKKEGVFGSFASRSSSQQKLEEKKEKNLSFEVPDFSSESSQQFQPQMIEDKEFSIDDESEGSSFGQGISFDGNTSFGSETSFDKSSFVHFDFEEKIDGFQDGLQEEFEDEWFKIGKDDDISENFVGSDDFKPLGESDDFDSREEFLLDGKNMETMNLEPQIVQQIEENEMAQINRLQVIEFCEKGDYDNLLRLLESNTLNLNFIDGTTGLTPLIIAGRRLHVDIVTYLLGKGADANFTDRLGKTFMHYVCQIGSIDLITLALSCGVDIHCVDEDGNSPLHIVCLYSNNVEIVKLLVAQGADICKANNKGNVPLVLAKDESIQRFLMECGQKVKEALDKSDVLVKRAKREKKLEYAQLREFEIWLERNAKNISPFVLQTILLDLSAIYREYSGKCLGLLSILKKIIEYVPFNYRFFNDTNFFWDLKLALEFKILDSNGESILSAARVFCKCANTKKTILQEGIIVFEKQLKMQNLNNSVIYATQNFIKHWLQFRNQRQNGDRYLIDFLNWLHKEDKPGFYRFVMLVKIFTSIRNGIIRECQRNGIVCGSLTDITAYILSFLHNPVDKENEKE